MGSVLFSIRQFVFLVAIAAAGASHAQNYAELFNNDKEVESVSLKVGEIKKIKKRYSDVQFNQKIAGMFFSAVHDFLDDQHKFCEPRLIIYFQNKLREEAIKDDEASIESYLKLLRVGNHIDDIFYDILTVVNVDYFRMKELSIKKKPLHSIFGRKKLLSKNPLEELYADFKVWPDEYEQCSYNLYNELKRNIRTKKGEISKKAKEMKDLNRKAFEKKFIDLATYRKLEFLREKSSINERVLWMRQYFDIIFKAKNKMRPLSYQYNPQELSKEDDFATEKVRRFRKITRRKLLYKKYDETQIILLAQVLQRASRRMGVDPDTISSTPYIGQEFNILTPSGERETYVEKIELDPQSQYNLARRLLRKDIVELQMMSSFQKLTITYLDVVMAAFEAGYISIEELEFVVKYDDLWNPEKTPFQKVMGFIFNIGRYGTFFLPPPWNVAASIAMGIAEGIIDNKFKTGVEHDNPATFIE